MRQHQFRVFALKFAVYFVVGHFFFLLPPVRRAFVEPWTSVNARWAAGIANLLEDGGYVVENNAVQAGGGRVTVQQGCNGVDALCLCASAILAFPAPWRRRALGVLVAVVGVFGLNLVRLANLFFVARHFPERLELFHIYIWQTLIGILALGLFLIWGRYLVGPRTETPPPAPP